jgi:hypothetical protein
MTEAEGSTLLTAEPTIGTYPESFLFKSHPDNIYFSKIHFNIIFPLFFGLLSAAFQEVSQCKFCIHVFSHVF